MTQVLYRKDSIAPLRGAILSLLYSTGTDTDTDAPRAETDQIDAILKTLNWELADWQN